MPYSLWPEAIEFVATCLNLEDEISPWQLFYGKDPAAFARFLHPFGCLAWVFVPIDKREGGKECLAGGVYQLLIETASLEIKSFNMLYQFATAKNHNLKDNRRACLSGKAAPVLVFAMNFVNGAK